jgi:pimeloyl-ACP methyl ester carboxylesterase
MESVAGFTSDTSPHRTRPLEWLVRASCPHCYATGEGWRTPPSASATSSPELSAALEVIEDTVRVLVVALDWRGHGASQRPAGDYTTHDVLDDALAVIERAHAAAMIPVGLSHAGWVAIELRRRLDWMFLAAGGLVPRPAGCRCGELVPQEFRDARWQGSHG